MKARREILARIVHSKRGEYNIQFIHSFAKYRNQKREKSHKNRLSLSSDSFHGERKNKNID